jgi:hypothetical protein
MATTEAKSNNMRLVSHHALDGFGNVGEGMSIQLAKDGRRILWLAHESAPKNFTAVDVSDIKNPKIICQTELPHQKVRSNSLEVCGDLMAVAYQTNEFGLEPAGIEMFDISTPEEPKSVGFFDRSGPFSRGVHQVWFVDGEYIHCAAGSDDFVPRYRRDFQFYTCVDARDPANMKEVGRWWFPGQRKGDQADPLPRLPFGDNGWRIHNTNVYPERPDRVYGAYINGGAVTLDISDKEDPKLIGHWNPNPPFPGFAHTSVPMLGRDLLIVTHETNVNGAADWPKLTWVLDNREETNPVSISTLPLPPLEEYGGRPGRCGAHNIHENRPGPSFRSEQYVVGNYFNAGVRVHDISDPFHPKEVAFYEPEAPEGSRVGEIQMNDVYVDENQIVYTVDRLIGGLYILEMDI